MVYTVTGFEAAIGLCLLREKNISTEYWIMLYRAHGISFLPEYSIIMLNISLLLWSKQHNINMMTSVFELKVLILFRDFWWLHTCNFGHWFHKEVCIWAYSYCVHPCEQISCFLPKYKTLCLSRKIWRRRISVPFTRETVTSDCSCRHKLKQL